MRGLKWFFHQIGSILKTSRPDLIGLDCCCCSWHIFSACLQFSNFGVVVFVDVVVVVVIWFLLLFFLRWSWIFGMNHVNIDVVIIFWLLWRCTDRENGSHWGKMNATMKQGEQCVRETEREKRWRKKIGRETRKRENNQVRINEFSSCVTNLTYSIRKKKHVKCEIFQILIEKAAYFKFNIKNYAFDKEIWEESMW